LQNVIERAVVVHEKGELSVNKDWLAYECFLTEPAPRSRFRRSARDEREIIGAALAEAQGRVSGPSGAAAKLGIPASTLESKIRAMKINKYSFKAA
jgi:DNA-binding NtrC family response regulator